MTTPALFAPQGLLALRADAYGKPYEPGPRTPAQLLMQSASGPIVVSAAPADAHTQAEAPKGACVAFVNIRGPLAQHLQFKPEAPQSYEEILCWGRYAICNPWTTHVVLLIASPGGVVAGCFETARTLRDLAKQNGKRLFAFVEGQACSAAYAFASACEWVATADASELGSVGVIGQFAEQTELDAKLGVRYELVTSGARKADGNPHIQVTDPARVAMQTSVDTAAGLFYDFVSTHRPLTRDAVQALEAATFFGAQAVELRLADQVCDREQFIAEIISGATEGKIMAMGYKEAVAALAATMTDDKADEGDKKNARRMLAALAADDDAPEKKDDKSDDDEKEKESKKSEDDKKEKEAASATSALTASTHDPEARRMAKEARDIAAFTARSVLYGARADLTAEQRTMLDGLPLKAARDVLQAMAPTPAVLAPAVPGVATQAQVPAVQAALAASQAVPPAATVGNDQPPAVSEDTRKRMAAMGLADDGAPRGITATPLRLIISARPALPAATPPAAAPVAAS